MKKYRKQSWINPHVEIKSSPLHGKGMFAVAPIKKGEIVVVWGLPERYDNKEDAEKAAAKGRAKGKAIIVGQLDENLFTVEERGDDLTHFMNHSCDPNVWMNDEVTLVARRDIKPKEELTLDYALIEADENYIVSWECVCGSKLCRKRVTGQDWRISDLQERYKDHFTPLINKRIARAKEQKILK